MVRNSKLLTLIAMVAMVGCSGGNNVDNGGGGGNAGNALDVTFRYADGTPFNGGTWWTQNDSLGAAAAFTAMTDPVTGVDCDDVPSDVTSSNAGCIDTDGHGFIPNLCTDTSPGTTQTYIIYLRDSNGVEGTTVISCAAVGAGDDDVGGTTDVSGEIDGIVLYQTTATTDGNIGGRSGADAMCEAAMPAGLSQTAVRAFIGVNGEDSVANLLANYNVPHAEPIHGVNGAEIATSWGDLLDNTIAVALNDAGVSASTYWTGSLDDGTYPNDSCNGWTNNDAGGGVLDMVAYSGAIGSGAKTFEGWLGNNPEDCSVQHVILCIAFNPDTH